MKPYELHLATRSCDLSASERAVLREVAMFSNGDEDICWASQETIGEALDMPDRTVRRELAALVELGVLVEVDSKKRTKCYRVVPSAIPPAGSRPGFVANRDRGRTRPAGGATRQAVPGGRGCQSDRQAVPVRPAGPAYDQIQDPIPDPIPPYPPRGADPDPPGDAVELVAAIVDELAPPEGPIDDLEAMAPPDLAEQLRAERLAEADRVRDELWELAALGDAGLAQRVLHRGGGRLTELGVKRVRSVGPLLVAAARQRRARAPPIAADRVAGDPPHPAAGAPP